MTKEIISSPPSHQGGAASQDIETDAEHLSFVVGLADHGSRIDKFLAKAIPALSRSYFQQLITQGDVTLGSRLCAKSSAAVKVGQGVGVTLRPTEQALSFAPEPIPLDIVFEDSSLLVINKPAGLVVHPGAGNWSGTVLNGLLHRIPETVHLPRAGIVHRLDKDTSGLMVVAKTREVMEALVHLIAERKVARLYVALAERHWQHPETIEVQTGIGRDPGNRLRMSVQDVGRAGVKHSHTAFKVLSRVEALSLVACKLFTGRTHQIRVHLSWLGHPILADKVYGGHPDFEMRRQALHATRLTFPHPANGACMDFSCSPPPDMEKAMRLASLAYNTKLIDSNTFT